LGSSSDREGDPGGPEAANAGAVLSISAPRSEVIPHAAGTENRGEIGRAIRSEVGVDVVEFRAEDRRSDVAEAPGVDPLVPHSVISNRRSVAAVAAPSDERTGRRTWHSAAWHAAAVAVDAFRAESILARSRTTLAARDNIHREKHTIENRALSTTSGCLDLDRATERSCANFSNSRDTANPFGEKLFVVARAIAPPSWSIRKTKHADDSRPNGKSISSIGADCALWRVSAHFHENQNIARDVIFGEVAAQFAILANIRKTKRAGIFCQFAESSCEADLIRARFLGFSNFDEMPRSGEFSSSTCAPGASGVGSIRQSKHFNISSLNTKKHCAAGISARFKAAVIFRILKLKDFCEPRQRRQEHIRRGELFSTSSPSTKNRCAAGISASFCGGAIFGPLKLQVFFASVAEGEKHIRRGEVFDTSCPDEQAAGSSASRAASSEDGGKPFIFSEFSGNVSDGFAASIYIRKAKLSGISCPGASREISGVCASEGFAARPFWAVNSGECLTEINAEKLPDFSKVISQAPSSESITGINADTLPNLAIPDLSESINGISAQSSSESAPINSRESFTGINARFGDSPFEQTRLADSSIRAFPVRIAREIRVRCDRSPFAPACVCVRARAAVRVIQVPWPRRDTGSIP
jgi:hypothetical protein